MEIIAFDLTTIFNKLILFVMIFLFLFGLMVAAIMIDLWDGISTAKKLGEEIKSHILRITMRKVSEYFRFLLIAFLVDILGSIFMVYIIPFGSILFCLGLVCVEIKSLFEHAKRRKSKAVEMKEVLQTIIRAANDHDAVQAFNNIQEFIKTNSKVKE